MFEHQRQQYTDYTPWWLLEPDGVPTCRTSLQRTARTCLDAFLPPFHYLLKLEDFGTCEQWFWLGGFLGAAVFSVILLFFFVLHKCVVKRPPLRRTTSTVGTQSYVSSDNHSVQTGVFQHSVSTGTVGPIQVQNVATSVVPSIPCSSLGTQTEAWLQPIDKSAAASTGAVVAETKVVIESVKQGGEVSAASSSPIKDYSRDELGRKIVRRRTNTAA